MFFSWPVGLASANAQFQEIPVEYAFGGQVTFRVQIQTDTPAQATSIFYRFEGLSETYQGEATLASAGEASYTLEARQAMIPAFSRVDYWFVVSLEDGTAATSPTYSFVYFDHRFTWNPPVEELPLRIYWYGGDLTDGQRLLAVARQGLEKINRLIGALPSDEIDLYIYENALDMQSTLRLANVKWIAGHADPWLGVVVITLPSGPEQLELSRQRIPHELMHILLYQHIGAGYANLPIWLNEGLASMAELQNNPDYYTILERASEQKLSLPLAGLCHSFPQDASNAFLAYAQSEVFTRYLYEQYGAKKIQELIAAYADGLACERAPEVVLGKSLAQLETEWRSVQFGENVLAAGLSEVLPWLVLLVIAISSPLALMVFGPSRHGRKP